MKRLVLIATAAITLTVTAAFMPAGARAQGLETPQARDITPLRLTPDEAVRRDRKSVV